MKILRYVVKASRRNNSGPRPKKKALLIGITYNPGKNGERVMPALDWPLRDVDLMHDVLTKRYGYNSKDIVRLTDKDPDSELRPTRAVILEHIRKLVEGAETGDRFFLLYAGHGMQKDKPNMERSFSEEDGKDECLVPVDGEDHAITDNELRALLVDALPIGSSLTAVFDACHSGSLLDLKHSHCNQVFVPWLSKGKRKSDTMRYNNVRQPANDRDFGISSRIIHRKRVSAKSVSERRTSIDQVMNMQTKAERLVVKTKSLSIKSEIGIVWYGDEKPDSPIQRCDSPIPMYSCDGFDCRNNEDHTVAKARPEVISLASCQDSQITFEQDQGETMTKLLVKILNKNPNPTLKELMTTLSHLVYKTVSGIHTDVRVYKKRKHAWARRHPKEQPKADPGNLDMTNFQDPSLASDYPLDMENTRWRP